MIELRRIISKHQQHAGLVSQNHALNVVESLVLKAGRGTLDKRGLELHSELQTAGFISA